MGWFIDFASISNRFGAAHSIFSSHFLPFAFPLFCVAQYGKAPLLEGEFISHKNDPPANYAVIGRRKLQAAWLRAASWAIKIFPST